MTRRATRYVDLPAPGRARGRCVVLPGRQYTPDAPLLSFAAQVARAHGWAVRQVWWEAAERGSRSTAEEIGWAAAQLDAAVHEYDGRVLVVGKSLGTLAATRAAERAVPAAWLTPLLTEPEAAEPLLTYPAAQFVALGAEDPYLSRQVLNRLPGTGLVVPGYHVLHVAGDPVAAVESHLEVVRALDAWLARLEP